MVRTEVPTLLRQCVYHVALLHRPTHLCKWRCTLCGKSTKQVYLSYQCDLPTDSTVLVPTGSIQIKKGW